MAKKTGLWLFLIAVVFLFSQTQIQAQQETVPSNAVLLINRTTNSIRLNLESKETGKWGSTGFDLLPNSDVTKTEVSRIAIYEGGNPRVVRELVLGTRYKFFYNEDYDTPRN